MTYIMSCVWLDYMVKYFQCKNCVGSSLKTKKCVASFLVPGDKKTAESGGFLFLKFSFMLLEGTAFTRNSSSFYISRDTRIQ